MGRRRQKTAGFVVKEVLVLKNPESLVSFKISDPNTLIMLSHVDIVRVPVCLVWLLPNNTHLPPVFLVNLFALLPFTHSG